MESKSYKIECWTTGSFENELAYSLKTERHCTAKNSEGKVIARSSIEITENDDSDVVDLELIKQLEKVKQL